MSVGGEEINSFINERKGREIGPIFHLCCLDAKRNFISGFPWAVRGLLDRRSPWRQPLIPECCLTGSVVYIGSAKSQQDQNLACKAQQLCKTNCGRQRSFCRVGNQHSTALFTAPSPPPSIYPPPTPQAGFQR